MIVLSLIIFHLRLVFISISIMQLSRPIRQRPNLLLCNDTITVLKITLLNSVSAITNVVIQKRDK